MNIKCSFSGSSTALLVVFFFAAGCVHDVSTDTNQGWYTIIGSTSFRPNWEYICAVTVSPENNLQPTTVTVEIKGQILSNNTEYKTSQSTTIDSFGTKTIELQVGDISPGKYQLTVHGEGGLDFSNSTDLEFQSKSLSLFIQTDKAVYKPNAKVQIRVLVLDPNLKPSTNKDIHVYITDGEKNRVKEWRKVEIKKGVWSGEIRLSDCPVLGLWTIHVSAQNHKISKNFEVAEYVLPKFEVTLNAPEHFLFKDGKIPVHISAKYTYGGGVKGEATVIMKTDYPRHSISKIVPIDGETTVDFDIFSEYGNRAHNIDFEVSVEEGLTGKKRNATGSVFIHNKEFRQELFKKSTFFKPGLRTVLYLKVSRYDGTPVTDNSPVTIRTTYTSDSRHKTENYMDYEVPPSGLVKIFVYPSSEVTSFDLEAIYKTETKWLSKFKPASSPSNNFIDSLIVTPTPQVGSEIEVDVNMTEHSPTVMYQVVGRGGIILAGSLPVDQDKTTATLRFIVTPLMAPKSKLLVYYVREDKEVVVDYIDIDIDYTLPNFVKVVSNITESEPGQGIALNLVAKPNSYIGLLGVDQSVLLLKKGNDIDKENTVNELMSYSMVNPKKWMEKMTAKKIFNNAGTFVLTNGNVYDFEQLIFMPRFSAGMGGFRRFGGGASSPVNFVSRTVLYDSPPSMVEHKMKNNQKPRLRSNFPETWIWQGVDADEEGRATLNDTIPDTISSWVISAFSIDSSNGLGLIDQPTKIKVFRPFFISLDLPYSIIRGETVTIPVLVFNYMDTEATADVTLVNSAGQFEFADDTNSISDKSEKALFKRETLTVKPNSGEKTSFTITATELGFISIRVTAKSDLAGDAVERKLLVKAEGETQYMNQAIFVDLRNVNSLTETVAIDIPDNHVPGSSRVEVSTVGDILGTSLQNLESLIRMPYGCGEQNMLNFVPNIVILDYLKNSGQLTPTVENKCLKYMDMGYQRELTYKHDDGSFSAFGKSDRYGSTWLTAFVLKSFASAEAYMGIDREVINTGLEWLAKQQASNGSFPEVGTVSHKEMQGGSGQGLALTSYCLLPFLAYRKPEYDNTVEKALSYVVEQLGDISDDSYSLAISAYVLHLAQHPAKDAAFEQLESIAHSSQSKKWWKRAEKSSDKENPHAKKPNSVDVEMTAYAMLTYLERGLVENSVPIMNWLMSQQNSGGGFASTQDTVVALTALSKFAEKIIVKNPDIKVTFSTDEGFSKEISINSDNILLLQKLKIPGEVDKVMVKAEGHGLAVVQVSYSYNVDVKGAWPMFNLQTKVSNNSDTEQLLLDICSSFVSGAEGEDESSNMVVMEVSLPSGYVLEQDSLQSLQTSENVKRVELKEGDTHVVLYFDQLTKKEICPKVVASRSHKVERPKPVPVTVYDYYDQSRRARVFYSPLDTCQQDSCSTEQPE